MSSLPSITDGSGSVSPSSSVGKEAGSNIKKRKSMESRGHDENGFEGVRTNGKLIAFREPFSRVPCIQSIC